MRAQHGEQPTRTRLFIDDRLYFETFAPVKIEFRRLRDQDIFEREMIKRGQTGLIFLGASPIPVVVSRGMRVVVEERGRHVCRTTWAAE